MAFCRQCGSPLAGERFCGNCGTPAQEQGYQQMQGNPQQQWMQPPMQPQMQPPMQPQMQPPVQRQMQPPVQPQVVVHTGGGMSSLLKCFLALALVAAVVVGVLYFTGFFKSDETLIRERIEAFEEAYNNGDLEGVTDCFDPKSRGVLNSVMGLTGEAISGLAGFDIDMGSMFSLGSLALPDDGFRVEILEIEISGDYATVSVHLTAELNVTGIDAAGLDEYGTFTMVKDDGDWFIDLQSSDFLR